MYALYSTFVLVISTSVGPLDNWTYVGHFDNCIQAHIYKELHHPEATASRCLLEEYIILPDNLEYIDRKVHGK